MLRDSRNSYGIVSIAFHWTIALLFLVQIALGYFIQAIADHPRLQFDLYQWHKSFGFLVLALALLRIVWAFSGIRPIPAPDAPRWERTSARIVHFLLLALTLIVPLAGWAIASVSPLRIPSFAFDLIVIPDLPLKRSEAMEALWSRLHALLAYGAGLLVLGHASAAIHHHIRKHDNTLMRMFGAKRKN